MGSWDRIRRDASDKKLFVPMNVDGGIKEANFFNSFKMAVLICMSLGTLAFLVYVFDSNLGWILNTLAVIFILFIDFMLLRYCVFEEAYQSKMYKKMKKYEVTTANIFWNIANMRETEYGTVIVYSDLKVGVLIKLERDTVIGKPKEYRDIHYDAISDFYREMNIRNLNYIQLSLMESTGKDPRLNKLDEMVTKAEFNPNLAKLMEAYAGHTRNITRVTLFESDYILIYTDQPSRSDFIIQEAMDCCEKLSGSAFVECRILNKEEIIDMMRDIYDIKYFDYSSATLKIFDNEISNIQQNALEIIGLEFTDETVKELSKAEKLRLDRVQELLDEGTITKNDWSVKEALEGKLKHVGVNTEATKFDFSTSKRDEDKAEYADIDTVLLGDIDENIVTAQESTDDDDDEIIDF